MAITLSALLDDFVDVPADWDKTLGGLSLDSRSVKPGDLFLAYPGEVSDGRNFIAVAIEQGAAAVLCEAGDSLNVLQDPAIIDNTIPLFVVEKLSDKISHIASRFYANPSEKMTIIGVTGTNGKSSVCHYLAQALTQLGKPCAVMGTVGNGFPEQLQTAHLTTPDAITVQRLLAEFHQQGAQVVAMEVSSHSLVQARVAAVAFDIAIFTNLSRDHLDYHGDMQTYGRAKQQLFEYPSLKQAILNVDDAFGEVLLDSLLPNVTAYTYSLDKQHTAAGKPVNIYASDVALQPEKICANIQTIAGQAYLESGILGRFNLSNLLAVLSALQQLGIALADAVAELGNIQAVPGRMESLGGGDQRPLVIVDYAHTPDALEQVLLSLSLQCQGEIWCVFGCGGERDVGKRPLMAQIAERYAQHVVVTNDNPRREEPAQIVADIFTGFVDKAHIIVEHDRELAIRQAVAKAKPGDYVLVAGKGHESYQLIGETTLDFNDKQLIKRILSED